MPKVYLETTLPSYLTAWSSRDLIKAAHQRSHGSGGKLAPGLICTFRSLSCGKPAAATQKQQSLRLETLKGIPVLALISAASALAQQLVQQGPLPENAVADALHIGIATVTEWTIY